MEFFESLLFSRSKLSVFFFLDLLLVFILEFCKIFFFTFTRFYWHNHFLRC
jgi:hypothetical protein